MRSVRYGKLSAVERPQKIEDEEAMKFFGGEEGDVDLSQG